MSAPSTRRRGLRRGRRVAHGLAVLFFCACAFALLQVFRVGASPLPAAAALYLATVAYGLGEMAHLRERRLFRPGKPPQPDGAVLWWTLRIVLVLAVSSLPAVLLLGGLTRR